MQSSEIKESSAGQEVSNSGGFYPLGDASVQDRSTAVQLLPAAETILYVEDEAFVRKVTSEILRRAGYRVFTASHATEAAQMFQERPFEFDLLLTDVILPGETGPRLAARLCRMNPELRILFVTGYGDQMSEGEQWQGSYLAKPFSSEILVQRIKDLLQGKEPRHNNLSALKRACGTA